MSTLTKIFEGVSVFSSQQFISIIIGTLSTLLLIGSLGTYSYGLLVLTMASVDLANILFDITVNDVVVSDMAREMSNSNLDRVKSIFMGFAQVEVAVGILLFLGLALFSNAINGSANSTVVQLVQISAVLLLLTSIKNVFATAFLAHAKFIYYSTVQIAEIFIRLILLFLLLVVFKYGLLEALYAYIAASFLAMLIAIPLVIKTIGYLGKVKQSKENLYFAAIRQKGKWSMLSLPLKRFSGSIHSWIIKIFIGVEAVAVFDVAYNFFVFLESLVGTLEDTLMPITANQISNWERVQLIMNRSIKYTFIFALLVVIGTWFAAPFILTLLFKTKYLASLPLIRLLILMLPIHAFGFVFRPVFNALSAQKYLFYVYLGWTASLLVFEIAFAYLLGLPGVALAMVLGIVVATLIRYHLIHKLRPFKLSINLGIDEFDKEILRRLSTEIPRKIFRKA